MGRMTALSTVGFIAHSASIWRRRKRSTPPRLKNCTQKSGDKRIMITRLEEHRRFVIRQRLRMDAETDENAFYYQLVPLLMARLRIISIASPEPRQAILRSEERRVGKECRSRWSPYN